MISIYFILKLYVHVIRTDEGSHGDDNGWIQEDKPNQYRAFKAGLSVLTVPWEKRAQHPAQNKPA